MVMKILSYMEAFCLALSVLGMLVAYAYETLFATIIMHGLAYNALICICLMMLTAIVNIIIEVIKSKKNK